MDYDYENLYDDDDSEDMELTVLLDFFMIMMRYYC